MTINKGTIYSLSRYLSLEATTKNVSENRMTFKKKKCSDTGNIGHKKQKS